MPRATQPATTPPPGDVPERSHAGARFLLGLALFFAGVALFALWREITKPAWASTAHGPIYAQTAFLMVPALFVAYYARASARSRIDDVGLHTWSVRGWRTLRWVDVVDIRFERAHGGIVHLRSADGRVVRLGLSLFRNPEAAADFVHARTQHAAGNQAA